AGIDLRLWDVPSDSWSNITRGRPWMRRIEISPGGEYLFEVDQTRSTDWAAGGGLLVRETSGWDLVPEMPGSGNTPGGIPVSHDQRYFATGHIRLVGEKTRSLGPQWGHYTTNDYEYVVHLREFPPGGVIKNMVGWQQAIRNLVFSPDGSVLAGTAGPRLRIWDLASNREVALHKR